MSAPSHSLAKSLRYAIIGTGAIGGYYGARLQQAGCDVHFLLRSDYETVRSQGLRIESVDGDFTLPAVKAYLRPADMPPVDVAIVALKTTQNDQIHSLLPQIKSTGAILSFQNGFAVEPYIEYVLKKENGKQEKEKSQKEETRTEEMRKEKEQNVELVSERQQVKQGFLPTILGGLCFICANKVGPGHIRHLDFGRLIIGGHNTDGRRYEPTPLMTTIAADFNRAKIPTELTDDLPMARWRKLVWNVPFNGLSVVLNATTAEMMADEGVRSLIQTLMEEVVAIANAWGEKKSTPSSTHTDLSPVSDRSGRSLAADIVDKMLAHTETMPPYLTSMKIDYDAKRPLELTAILGAPLSSAKALRVHVPHMNMLYQQLIFLNISNTNADGITGKM
ncbi:MAG: 2-dehydropantoate 2-reductase N-terminal domain-containing protein [Cyanobacteria bacterium J06649_4]